MRILRTRSAFWLVGLVLALLIIPVGGTASASDSPDAVIKAIDWLNEQRGPDGGYPGFEGASDPGATADAVVALVAAGQDVNISNDGEPSPIDYLESVASEYSETQGGAARLVLAVHAAGGDPEDFAGIDIIEMLQDRADASSGAYDEQVFIHATAVLAVLATGNDPVDGAIEFLLDRQIEDGSWAFTGDTEPGMGDTNTTSMVMQALAAAGSEDDAIEDGLDYLLEAQLEDGSVVYAIGMEDPPLGDSNSTALAIQAMIAAGMNEADDQLLAASEALLAFLNDSGALHYRGDMPEDNALSTAQAIPAMMHLAFPIEPTETGAISEHELIIEAAENAEAITSESCSYFEITGHNICDEINEYWWQSGGLAIFGYPITEEFTTLDESGSEIIVQYFERSRFELDSSAPDGERLSVSAIGADRAFGFEGGQEVDMEGDCEEFQDANHSVCGVFLEYWNAFGGLDTFGVPVTPAHTADGMTVQYFEFARFEHQPGEWAERFDVLLGRIGSERVNEVLAE